MAAMTIYTVNVTRDEGAWQADVKGLAGAHTYARTLTALNQYVREVIVLAADLPDEAMNDLELIFRYDVADVVVNDAAQVGRRRDNLDAARDRLADETHASVERLLDAGYSMRDVATLVGLTPARVSQLHTQRRQARAAA